MENAGRASSAWVSLRDRDAMRLRGIQMVRIAGELLRQYSNHESAVVAQSCAVLRRSLCIESYVHHFVFSLIIGTKVY